MAREGILIPRGVRWLAGAWILAYLAWFWIATVPIRSSNADDSDFDHIVDRGQVWEASVAMARDQGRFYVPIAFGPIAAQHVIDDPYVFALVRACLLAGQIAALAYFMRRAGCAAAVTLAVAIAALLFLQIPGTFHGILSYPQAAIGFILTGLVGGILLEPAGEGRSAVAVGAFAAAAMNECFFPPLAALAAAAWFKPDRRPATGAILGLTGYLISYLSFKAAHPSAYGGTILSLDLGEALGALAKQLIATVPGFELAVNRSTDAALFRTQDDIFATLTNIEVIPALLGLTGAAVLAATVWASRNATSTFTMRRAALVAGCAVLFVLPACFTDKHQVWAHQRQFPYLYSFHAWLLLTGVATALAAALVRPRNPASRSLPALLAVLCLLSAAASLAIAASNRRVLRELAAGQSRPLLVIPPP